MTILNVTLPKSIQRHMQEMADLDGVPIDQFVVSAISEKISALTAEAYLRKRGDPVGRHWPETVTLLMAMQLDSREFEHQLARIALDR